MAEKTEYAISYSAIKFYPNGCADISNGIHIILATDEKSAELDAMKISLEKCSPGDGYIGHVAAVVKIFSNAGGRKYDEATSKIEVAIRKAMQ